MSDKPLHDFLRDVLKPAYREILDRKDGEQCQRCRRYVPDVGEHLYWPGWRVCPRCVQVLLEIKQPPFVLLSNGTCITFKNEREFWESPLSREAFVRNSGVSSS